MRKILRSGWMILALVVVSACSMTPEQEARQIEKGIMEDPTTRAVWVTIKENHPAEFSEFVERIRAIPDAKLADEAFMTRLGGQWMIDLQNANIPFAVKAPQAELIALTKADLDLYETLRRTSVSACAGLATNGTFEDGNARGATKRVVSQRNVAFFAAVAAGREDPQDYTAPSDDDFALLGESMIGYGVSDRAMAALGDLAALMSLSHAEQCEIGVAVSKAVMDMDEDKAAQMSSYLMAASQTAP